MSVSRSSKKQLVHLKSISGPIEIRLLDKSLKTVDIGYGELERKVEPGLYMIKLDSGTDQEDRFFTVEPDKCYENLELSIPIRSAAPLQGITQKDNPQSAALSRLSRKPIRSSGPCGRLIVFVRNHEDWLKNPIDLSNLSIRDEQMNHLDDKAVEKAYEQKEGWACRMADLKPGGYMINWKNKRHSLWSSVQRSGNIVDQPVWIQHDWITAVFLATNPKKNGTARMTGMTVHMRHLDVGFVAHDNEQMSRINQAQELALGGLRKGNTIVPIGLQNLLLEEKGSNPMLGILGAHALLQKYHPKWSVFDQVVRRLQKIIPGHPDVIALRLMGKLRRNIKDQTRTQSVKWPPMIYQAYRGMIERDWDEGGLIEAGSVADHASARLLPQGPWTVWASIDEDMEIRKELVPESIAYAEEIKEIFSETKADARFARRKRESASKKDEAILMSDSVVDEVRQFLENMEEREVTPAKAVQQLKHLGLPVSSVKRGLHWLADKDT